MIGALTMATKGSSADPSHTPRKLKSRGGRIDYLTGVADGLIVAFFAHHLATAFHNRHRDLSLFNSCCCMGGTVQCTWAHVPGT